MLRSTLQFLAFALMVSLLPLRVHAALPKELPTAPTKFLTGACLTRSEDLWIMRSWRRLPSERTGDEAEVGGHAEAAGIPEDRQLHGCLRGFARTDLGRDLEHGRTGVPQGAMEALRPGYGPWRKPRPRTGIDLDRSFFGQFS